MAGKRSLSALELHQMQNENQSEVIRFRVTPTLKKQIETALHKLDVQDLSTFARGALLNAIEMAQLNQDPRWREFIATVNIGPAKAILGHGLTLPNGHEIQERGQDREGLTAAELKQKLAKGRKKVKLAR